MKIQRTELIDELITFARIGNGVVIGPPGIGKTYALAELRHRLKLEKTPHLILPVERLGDGSEEDLQLVLKRQGDFVKLLQSSVAGAQQKAVLVFDGFDAARGERERAGVLRVITRAVTELHDTWNVIVSVRSFDAKKSARLLRLFPPTATEQPDGKSCRSFQIPFLNDEELKQVFTQLPAVRTLWDHGSAEFQRLLRTPFQLWLIEQVLDSGAATSDFSSVTSEVQLLELFWDHRVRRAADAEDRESVLLHAANLMVQDHTLTVRREQVYNPATRQAWEGLLSEEILTELPEKIVRVGFTHNILFDFTAGLLLLDDDASKFADFVAEEPSRPLFLRPTLVFHFTWLWHFARAQFWDNFWYVVQREEAHLRQVVRLVLPAVIVAEARSLSDLKPLLAMLEQGNELGRNAVAFVLQALRVLNSQKVSLWCDFIRATSDHLHERFAWDAGMVALRYVEAGGLVGEARAGCGAFGRKLLSWAWSSREIAKRHWFDRVAGLLGIPIVAKTFATDPTKSRELLAFTLTVLQQPAFPVDCVFRLANETRVLVPEDPAFVGEIYERVFGREEDSEQETNIGGPVLGMISNRRQDFESCQYVLLQEYPSFLAKAPQSAIRSGLLAIQDFVLRRHVTAQLRKGDSLKDVTFAFAFRGKKAEYIEDGSLFWDDSAYPDRELQIASAILRFLGDAAENNDVPRLEEFLDIFAENARLAFLWSRLLFKGAEHPKVLAPYIWELTMVPAFLKEPDTLYALGTFLEKATPHLIEEQRRKIEAAILDTGKAEANDSARIEYHRNRLIGCIPSHLLISREAIDLRAALVEQSNLPQNEPLFSFKMINGPATEETYFRDLGVKPDLPANHELNALFAPLKMWLEKDKNPLELRDLLPKSATLRARLDTEAEADQGVIIAAWTQLSAFAADAILLVDRDSASFKELRNILLSAAMHPEPQPETERDAQWDSAVWSPAPRNEAAKLLPWIVAVDPSADGALDVIRKLASDPVPSVRFLLAMEIWRLAEKAPSLLWELAHRYVDDEQNGTVLYGFTGALWKMTSQDRARSRELVQTLLARVKEDNDEGCWKNLVGMVTDYAVKYEDEWASGQLAMWRENAVQSAPALSVSGQRLIEHLRPDQSKERFGRAREALLDHLSAVAHGLTTLQRSENPSSDDVQKTWRMLYGVIDEAVTRLYFAADVNPNLRQRQENPLTDVERRNFFQDILPVLQKVLSFGLQPETGMLLAPTAHYFMQLLNGMLPYDPRMVLRLAAEVISCSKRFSYNLDSLALGEVVKLIESILADFTENVQDDDSVNHLLSVLDAFAEAGWPDALSLVWRLDEIYR
jgi:NACHT domain